MAADDVRLRPNLQQVAAKVIDGEAILIDLSSGVYYNMEDVGAQVWRLIEQERSVSEIVATLTARYDAPPDRVRADVAELVAELQRERLVVPVEAAPAAVAPPEDAADGRKRAYTAPRLNVHRDMGELLALDPPAPGLAAVQRDRDDGSPG